MKKCKYLIFCLLLLVSSVTAIFANEQRIYDEADLFSKSELNELNTQLEKLEDYWSIDIYIISIDQASGKTPRAYADDFYDEHTNNDNGVLLLYDMYNREMYVSTSGVMIDCISDSRRESIFDDMVDDVISANYASSAKTFLNEVEKSLNNNPPLSLLSTGQKIMRVVTLLPVVAIIISAIVYLIATIKGRKGRKVKNNIERHIINFSSMKLDYEEDTAISSNTTQVYVAPRKSNNSSRSSSNSSSSSSGSSRHTSSSGRSHGGGGRKF